MARYQTDSFTSASINAASTLNVERSSLPNYFNIVKVKVTPNTAGGSFDFKIHKATARLSTDLLAFWDNVTNLYDPMDNSSGTPAEALEGNPIPYEDNGAGGILHLQITNNDSGAHTYTVTIEYEEVPLMSSAGAATFRGSILAAAGSLGTPSISFSGDTNTGLYSYGADVIGISVGGAAKVAIGGSLQMVSTANLGWTSSSSDPGTTLDCILTRAAAATLAQVNGTTAQQFRVYGTTTGPKFSHLGHDGTTGYAGTFADDTFNFMTGNTVKWTVQTSAGGGHFIPNANNSNDLGGSSNRVRTGYFGTSINVGLATATTGTIYSATDSSTLPQLWLSNAFADTNSAALYMRKSRGSHGSPANVSSGDITLLIATQAYSNSFLSTALIQAVVDGTFTAGQRPPSRWEFYTNAANSAQTLALYIDGKQNIIPGTAGLATNATDGFMYIESCAGAATGTPTTYSNRCALVYDRTNNQIYVYNGAWKKTVALT